jgi:hypothetical protein
MAAPSKWSKARAARILAARRAGASLVASAAAGGISRETLRDWRNARPEFDVALEQADAAHQREVLAALMPRLVGERDPETGERLRDPETGEPLGEVASPDVLMRWLAAKWPEEFGRRRVEMTGAGGGPVEVTDPEANRRALAARLERLATRRAEIGGNGGGPTPREPETANGGQGRA